MNSLPEDAKARVPGLCTCAQARGGDVAMLASLTHQPATRVLDTVVRALGDAGLVVLVLAAIPVVLLVVGLPVVLVVWLIKGIVG